MDEEISKFIEEKKAYIERLKAGAGYSQLQLKQKKGDFLSSEELKTMDLIEQAENQIRNAIQTGQTITLSKEVIQLTKETVRIHKNSVESAKRLASWTKRLAIATFVLAVATVALAVASYLQIIN